MLLSDILPLMGVELDINYKIENEKEFASLSLCSERHDFTCATFVDDLKYADSIAGNMTMVLTGPALANRLRGKHFGLCVTENPRILFFMVHNYLSDKEGYGRRKQNTAIGKNCKISKMSSIADIGVIIGDNVTIEEFVVIRENTTIGDNSIIRAGSVIGGEGFEFKRNGSGVMAVKHAGGVVIGQNVELQQCNCVDRAIYPWDDTVVSDLTKTDNLVHIAHGVKLGKGVFIAACGMIAGRTFIKDDAWIGPGASISNNIIIGQGSRVNIGAVSTRSVGDGESVTGNFAISHDKFIRNLKNLTKE